jgi:hypothetical protein
MPITLQLTRPDPAEDFSRADLEFRGVDHSGPSYEACIFLNKPDADETTPREPSEGYAGSFFIFGHAGCFGDLGHCDVREEPLSPYDYRQPHQLTPQFKTVIITEALRNLVRTTTRDRFSVTIVAHVTQSPGPTKDSTDPLKFESVSLLLYQDASAAGIPLPQELFLRAGVDA